MAVRFCRYISLLLLVLFISVSASVAQEVQNGFSGEAIRLSRDSIFTYMEGSFGAVLMVCAGIGTILSASMGMYSQSKVLLIAALGIFSVRSMTVTFFPDQADKIAVVDQKGPESGPRGASNSASPSPEPEPSPLPAPTQAIASPNPTTEPKATNQATKVPSRVATKNPTSVPTTAPSKKPTEAPTAAPTKAPTFVPTSPPMPTATVKPAATPVPTPAPKKCTGGRSCIMVDNKYCHCQFRLAGDDPDCTMIGERKCTFGNNVANP